MQDWYLASADAICAEADEASQELPMWQLQGKNFHRTEGNAGNIED